MVGVAVRGGFYGDAADMSAATLRFMERNPVVFLNIALTGNISGSFRKATKV